MFSRARKTYSKNVCCKTPKSVCCETPKSIVPNVATDSSLYIHSKKNNAIGKSSTIKEKSRPLAFSEVNQSKHGATRLSVKSALSRTRAGGSVAPKKKGFVKHT